MIKKCEWCKSNFELGEETNNNDDVKEFSNGGSYIPECGYFCCNEHFSFYHDQ